MDLLKLPNLPKEDLDAIYASLNSLKVVDILPICRKHPQAWDQYLSSIDEHDRIERSAMDQIYASSYNGLRAIAYMIEDHIPHTELGEADFIIYQAYGPVSYKHIFKYLAMIMISDCPGCCNALDFINVSRDGLLAMGNISGIYHT